MNWLKEKLHNCYQVEENNLIFWIYDKNYIRKKKLSMIDGVNLIIPKKITGIVLFYQDTKKKIFWCDYRKIWNKFETNDFFTIQILIGLCLLDFNLNEYLCNYTDISYPMLKI